MALRWSSEFLLAEYKDLQAKSIALDSTGNFLLLPGRTHLGIKNLNKSVDEIQVFPRSVKYEIGTAVWNSHYYNKELCALCAGTSVELVSWNDVGKVHNRCFLKSHTRLVTDADWHPVDPNIIVTSSLDTFTYVWDIREPHKPVISFSSFAGASFAKWNKLSRHLLATTHGGDLKIWDERKGCSPVQYITAHSTNICCTDWSTFQENQISTSCQDGTVKIFDVNHPRKDDNTIVTEAPVWKARYTPFGKGMLVIVIPVALRRTENSVLLWNLSNSSVPLHTFVGHTEIVLDFQWRFYQQEGSEYQLITWSKDQTLRIWEIDKYLQELCGQMVGETDDLDFTDGISECCLDQTTTMTTTTTTTTTQQQQQLEVNKSQSCSTPTASDGLSDRVSIITQATVPSAIPTNLQEEFSSHVSVPNVHVTKTDLNKRMCCATMKYNDFVVTLLVNFPPGYPKNKVPIFRFGQDTTVSNHIKLKILEALRDTSECKVRSHQPCLEACLRTLATVLPQQVIVGEAEKLSERLSLSFNTNQGQATYLVSPKTCGAKFCHVGNGG